MSAQRLIYWKIKETRAYRALHAREWWDGRKWRAADEIPTPSQAEQYRTAHDRLGEILEHITDGRRFWQSANALMKADPRKEESADAWTTLAARFTSERLLLGSLDKKFLCDCADELRRGRHKKRNGKPWTVDGIKSFIRRQRHARL